MIPMTYIQKYVDNSYARFGIVSWYVKEFGDKLAGRQMKSLAHISHDVRSLSYVLCGEQMIWDIREKGWTKIRNPVRNQIYSLILIPIYVEACRERIEKPN